MTPPFPHEPDPDCELDDLIRELAATTTPPEPEEAEWDRVRTAIAARLTPVEPRRTGGWQRRVGWATVGGVAAAVAVVLMWPRFEPEPRPSQVEVAFDPLAEYDVLPIATPNDVMVSAVRGDGRIQFVACDHPLPGVMPLATGVELDVQWVQGGSVPPTPADAAAVMEPQDKDPERSDR